MATPFGFPRAGRLRRPRRLRKRGPLPGPQARVYGGGRGYDLEPIGPGTPVVTLHLNLSPSDLKTDAAADELAARIKRLLDALRSG